ncbi:MAG: hypothetical protein ACOYIP_07545 [Coriobacteriales bacterium]|jgi:hypothetical protein
MIRKDYFMRMIQEMVTMVRVGLRLPDKDKGSWLDDLEKAIGDAVKIDHNLLFSLDPESTVTMLDIGEVDKDLGLYVVHAIILEATMLEAEGQMAKADLRRRQARAIAEYVGCSMPASDATTESLSQFFMDDPELHVGKDASGGAAGDAEESRLASGLVLNGSLTQDEMDRFKF